MFEQAGELYGEAGEELGVAEGEEVFAEDARPEGCGVPVWFVGVLCVGGFVCGFASEDVAVVEGDECVVAVEEDYGEGDEEG